MRLPKAAAISAALAALAITGCSSYASTGGAAGTGASAGSSGQLVLGDPLAPTTYQAADMNWGNQSVYAQAVYDTLLRQAPDGTAVQPDLATSWTYNSGRTVLTLTLRQGVTFTDGTKFDPRPWPRRTCCGSRTGPRPSGQGGRHDRRQGGERHHPPNRPVPAGPGVPGLPRPGRRARGKPQGVRRHGRGHQSRRVGLRADVEQPLSARPTSTPATRTTGARRRSATASSRSTSTPTPPRRSTRCAEASSTPRCSSTTALSRRYRRRASPSTRIR